MLPKNLEGVATGLAAHVRKNWSFVPRGAVPVRLVDDTGGRVHFVEDGAAVVGVFGNDNYLANEAARREVEFIRKQLRTVEAEEVGFGLSQDGYTWALLVRVNDQRYETELGKAMQKELLKIFLEDAVARAWRQACGEAEGTGAEESKHV